MEGVHPQRCAAGYYYMGSFCTTSTSHQHGLADALANAVITDAVLSALNAVVALLQKLQGERVSRADCCDDSCNCFYALCYACCFACRADCSGSSMTLRLLSLLLLTSTCADCCAPSSAHRCCSR